MLDIGAETLRRHGAQTSCGGRPQPSPRIVPRRTLPLGLALLALGLLFPSALRGAEPNLRIYIAEGESFPLSELDPATTSQVTYGEGRHPFLLQCPARGTCYLLGAEAG
jgi:hypothetical protein